MTYEHPPTGNAGTPGDYGPPPGGYASPPPPPPGGYAPPPGAYGQPAGGYQQPAPGSPAPPAGYANPSWNYANWGLRLGGYVIDVAPVFFLYIIGGLIVSLTHSLVVYLLFLLAAIAFTVYNRWYLAGKTGQSLGKKVIRINLIDERSGQPIGALRAFARDIFHFLDCMCCFIGFLFPLWDAKRQTFADKIMGTVVLPPR